MTEQITNIRHEVDQIDDQILILLVKRIRLAQKIGQLKNHTEGSIYRPEREHSILQRLINQSAGLLSQQAVKNIFSEILSVTRNIESIDKVGYLGPEGSFTHQAAKEHLGSSGLFIPLKTIEAVFQAVESDHLNFGLIPIENNQAGTVNETVRNLYIRDVKIIAEVIIPIHMVIASRQEDLTKVERIYSKDIAFRQCHNFFKNFFVEHIPQSAVSSTSSAAQKAVENPTAAAICSKISAQLFDLPILFDNIQDSNHNYTRFIVISKTSNDKQPTKSTKTTILVNLDNSQKAGALASFLDSFKTNGINMEKLESFPEHGGKDFKYWFLIDFQGHFKDPSFQEIYCRYGQSIKWLGSYIRDEKYKSNS